MNLPKRQKEVLLAAVDGLPHTMRNDVIAPLSQKALIRVVENTPTGSAKKIEVTEWGQVVAKSLREDQQDQKSKPNQSGAAKARKCVKLEGDFSPSFLDKLAGPNKEQPNKE